MKIRTMGAEFRAGQGRTDMTKLIVAFRNLGNSPKNERNRSVSHNICRDNETIL
jgi:hypothetical protein